MSADLTFRPGEKARRDAEAEKAKNVAKARQTLFIRDALTKREARDLMRWVLRLVNPERQDLAPTSGVFNPNAMTMAHDDGQLAPIRLLWQRLGEHAREARCLMEQEDHDERSPVHTN